MEGLITNTDALSPVLEDVGQAEVVAIDTEADSLHCYFEKLCLIQISTASGDYLVDPLAGIDLQPLLTAMKSRRVLFHGADFDLRMLRRAGLFDPQNMFDTMLAARLLGKTEFSLAALVKSYFGMEMVKASQKADWSRRPLTQQMADYARNDTHFLIELATNLESELRALDRMHWLEQSCERALRLSHTVRERDPDALWRIKGSAALRGRCAAILRELWQWRDTEARKMDRPAFKVLRNEDLIMVAERADQGQHWDLRHLRGSRRAAFDAAVQKGLETPEPDWPKRTFIPRTPRDLEAEKRVQGMRTIRDRKAAELNLDPSIIAPKAALEILARDKPQGIEMLMPWQLDLLEITV